MKNPTTFKSTIFVVFSLIFVAMVCIKCQNKATYTAEPEALNKTLDKIQKKSLSKYSLRSGGSDADKQPTFKDTLSNAIKLSVAGKYKESKDVFVDLEKTYPENEEVMFQIAVQDYYLGNYGNAIKRLTKLVNSKNKDLRHEAEFIMFHASTTLNDNFETAKKYLRKMAGDNMHPYQKDAKYQLSLMGS